MTGQRFAVGLAVLSLLAIAACRLGGGGMEMPPPVRVTSPPTSARPTELDPNLHLTLPPVGSDASCGSAPGTQAPTKPQGQPPMPPRKGP